MKQDEKKYMYGIYKRFRKKYPTLKFDEFIRELERDDFDEEIFQYKGFAGGGIAGIRRPGAIPPESGPQPQGLENLKYYVTNT